jgi:transcriptional regulator with XRE-family HTH domain
MARQMVLRVAKATGLTPTALARKAGITPSTLTRFLNGRDVTHALSTRTLAKVMAVGGFKSDARPAAADHLSDLAKNGDELALLELWSEMDRDERDFVLRVIRSALASKAA